ncbi:hypothetical protein ccbrp13_46390 [Ktedonobacteria bacterium brp13]|nr:hypothetical protein ccbrp13_46390 [Ktedonobacteria bacterium brp13]
MDFQSPLTQFIVNIIVAVVVGVTAIIVAIWIYKRQKLKKEISYEIVSNAPLVSINEKMKDRIKILLDGSEMNSPRLIVIKLINTGNDAVKKDDIEDPLSIQIQGATIISAEVLNTDPQNFFLKPEDKKDFVQWQGSEITLQKKLFNPKDEISISTLIDGEDQSIYVGGRIANAQIKALKQQYNRAMISYLIPFLLMLGISISVYEFTINTNSRAQVNTLSPLDTILTYIAAITVVSAVALYLYDTRRKNK